MCRLYGPIILIIALNTLKKEPGENPVILRRSEGVGYLVKDVVERRGNQRKRHHRSQRDKQDDQRILKEALATLPGEVSGWRVRLFAGHTLISTYRRIVRSAVFW